MRRKTASFSDSGATCKTASFSRSVGDGVSVKALRASQQPWIWHGEGRQLSPQTLWARKWLTDKFLWFLEREGMTSCGASECWKFLSYMSTSHASSEGRWSNPQMRRKLRPRTVHTYHGNLRTFFRFCVEQGAIPFSPLDKVPAPVARKDQIQPFGREQVLKLLEACKRSRTPCAARRNEAILLLLFDTGMRASELCDLRFRDVDFTAGVCRVHGKGDKRRSIPISSATKRALWNYLNADDPRSGDEPVFASVGGSRTGDPLTRSGLLQIIERLGKAAGIESVRCSPHTFRHTFAVEFLRNGGNIFSLKEMLGHEALQMVMRYVALADADIHAQHAKFSPVAALKAKR